MSVGSTSRPERLGMDKISALRNLMAEAETRAILRALDYTAWNRKQAAKLLEISYRGLLYKIRRYNITRLK